MEGNSHDAIVVGGGPGGYTAAIRLAQLGRRTLVVEKDSLGGVCLNWGCIPSKALISAAATVDRIRRAGEMGIDAGEPAIDMVRTQAWKAGIVERLTGSVGSLIRANGGEVANGTARLLDARTVEVRAADGSVARHTASQGIVLATGARLAELPGFAPDGERILTARHVVDIDRVPASMLVIGGGVVGLELGMMLQRLGTRLTVVEASDGLLPGVDRELVRVVERRLRARGAEVLTGAKALGWEPRGEGAAVSVEAAGAVRTVEVERVLVAVGFRPWTQGLGLDSAGVRVDARGHVAVDDGLRTSAPGVWAVGDLVGAPYLAHKAFREAEVAAEVIAGRRVRLDGYAMPAVVFTDPEVAQVGLTEAEARARGGEVRVGRFPFSASGRAMALGETEGFVKVVADAERILGVGIVGPEAGELIAEAAFALEMVAAPEDVAMTIHPHPTLSESVGEAFRHLLGEAVHVLNRKPARASRETTAA